MSLFINQNTNKSKDLNDIFLGNYSSKSRFAESFRTLRTNVNFSFVDRDFCSILVTSAGEQEGKTSAVANLGYTMAQAGKSVLMIDADLRKPSLSKLVHSPGTQGLTGILTRVLGTDIGEGSLETISVTELIRLIMLQKKTGTLSLLEADEKVDILFLDGELRDINWITRPDEKKLASVLVKNEVLNREDIKKAVSRQKITNQKLGSILINMGKLSRDDLDGLIATHMTEGLRTALQFKKGKYSFNNTAKEDYDQASFDPVDFKKLYKELLIGEEDFPYMKKEITAAIIPTDLDNLSILPSGNLPPNPSELLSSERLPFLLNYLTGKFDRLIIDTPPVLPASDALLLAPLVDGVIYIVKTGYINRELIAKALEQLEMAKANLLGVVLNHVDTSGSGYYRNYYKYYSKYYGKD